jgi:glucose/arabinose dehydrogenase
MLLALAAAALTGLDAPARAAVDWPTLALVRAFGGLEQPTVIAHAGDGSGRIFVVERVGRVRIVRGGAVVAAPFLDISSKIASGGQEQGLLGLAFPPGYVEKRHFYVYYTRRADGAIVIARYGLTSADRADAASEQVVITIPHPTFTNHNGGQIAFGPRDGYLYAGVGDGGSGGDPNNNAQNTGSLLGKLLRLDVEAGSPTYAVPSTNPTLGGQRSEIWAYGLRNPWRFSFDRQTGDLFIGDVGQGAWEEIDFQPAASPGGENYGWRITEGTHCFDPSSGCSTAGQTMPVAEYSSGSGGDCSVTGGYVYRGSASPRLRGIYFYGDYCSGRIWGLARDGAAWQSQLLFGSSHSISTFGEDEAGELYLANLETGTVYQLVDPGGCAGQAGGAVPTAAAHRVLLPLVPRGDCGV